MKTRARHALPSLASVSLAAGIVALGCGDAQDPHCSEPVADAKVADPTAGTTSRATAGAASAEEIAPVAKAMDAPAITVTVANAGSDRVLSMDAVHGSFDEPIVLVATPRADALAQPFSGDVAPSATPPPATPPPPAPSGEAVVARPAAPGRERVAVSISSAYSGGSAPVPLRLLDALSGRDVKAIDIAVGQQAYLRIAGDGLSRDATYRASLTIFGAEPAVYRVKIQSTKPHQPLGLRASKWSDTFADVPIFGRRRVRLTLPVDSAAAAAAPYHVAVRPPEEPPEGVRPLPACGIVAQRSATDDVITVSLPPLETGRYAGIVEIQGERLVVDVTLKNSFWWVWLLVAAGAAVSLGVREYVRYRTMREETEKTIAEREREVDKKVDGLFAWDEISVRNVLRLARGRKSYLALDDVAAILADAVPRERAERVEIDRALNETALPSPLRSELGARFQRFGYLSSRDDAREIDRGVAELARQARDGFQLALVAWLRELREAFSAAEARIGEGMQPDLVRDDPEGAKRVRTLLHVLGLLIEDARALALDSGISQGQADVLVKIEPTLEIVEGWVRSGRIPEAIVPLIHCSFGDVEPRAPEGAEPFAPGLRLRAHDDGRALCANEELTFELVRAEGALDEARIYEPPTLPVEWWVDGRPVVRGGPRLSYLFQHAGWLGWRRRRVEARCGGRVVASWYDRIRRPELSVAVYERAWSLGARSAATMVGVIVTGAAAVGLMWANKPFGGWSDYISAALTGLGADLTFVAGGGKLLQTVLETVVGKRKEEP